MSLEEQRRPLSPDQALPPVEPPNFGFVIQLFVVPAVIVSIIIAVWLLFTWLAQRGNDPQKYVQALRRATPERWQVAANLADALRNPHDDKLRKDPALARELSAILLAEMKRGQTTDEDLRLQGFLAKALGQMQIPDGLPALLAASQVQGSDEAYRLQLAALESIAQLAANQPPHQPLDDPRLIETLGETSRSDDARLRSVTAYAWGVIGGDPGRERLAQLLVDASPDVRYNAATGLARWGDERAMGVLCEMLDPANEAGLATEEAEQARDFKRLLIQINGVRAAGQLLKANPTADTQELAATLERLGAADSTQGELALKVRELEQQLKPPVGASS